MSLFKEKLELEVEEVKVEANYLLNKFPKWQKIIIIICIISFLPAYFLTKNISYKYWQNKYNSLRVYSKPSFENPKPLKVTDFQISTMGDGSYSAIAYIKNENLELSATDVPYLFEFRNPENKIIAIIGAETSGRAFFLPDQKKILAITKFTTLEPVSSGRIILEEKINWQKKIKIPKVKITTFTPSIKNQLDPLQFVLEGNFRNDSSYTIKKINLTTLVYNLDGKIIAVSQRTEYNVKPRENRTIKQIWPRVFSLEAIRGEIVAEVNTLDPENLTSNIEDSTNASDLSRPKDNNGF